MKLKMKRIGKNQIIILIVIATALLLYFLFWKPNPIIRINMNRITGNSQGARLYFDAPEEVSNAGKTIVVRLMLDTQGNSVNAVQGVVEFDKEALEIVSTSTKESFCKFYPENFYDNAKGVIRLACGAPYPGFKGKNTLESIEFLTKATKTTKLNISDKSLILANDGKGTNLLNQFESFSIKIKPTL